MSLFFLDSEQVLEMPSKESGYTLSNESNCNNGVKLSFDLETYQITVNYTEFQNNSSIPTKCNLHFREALLSDYITSCEKNGKSFSDCLKVYNDKEKEELAFDGTSDNNLRYIGSNPNNYVSFNNELWRVIGVMNNVNDEFDKKESRIKLVRNESIGSYSWDSSESNINGGYGINEWSSSSVNQLLNEMYYNGINGTCKNDTNNATTSCDFTSSGLNSDAKKMITKITWNTGSNGEITYNSINSSKFYELERSNNTGKNCPNKDWCNDTVNRTTKWIGMVGLPYPSDYGYATKGGINTTRETCLANNLYDWINESMMDCRTNSWLFDSNKSKWTMMPATYTGAYSVFRLFQDGRVTIFGYASNNAELYPVVYLNENIKIIEGEGTEEKPYILSL